MNPRTAYGQVRRPGPRRALVLPGGGAKGIWQVGVCQHLIAERGYWFDVISGVSAGAVNGVRLAHAHNPEELNAELEHLRSVWFGLRGRRDVYQPRGLGALGTVMGGRVSLYDSTPLKRLLSPHIEPPRVAASPIQLRIGYVDLRSGEYRTATNDHPSLLDAVLASCALPLLFQPVPLGNGQELGVDACGRNIDPLDDTIRLLAERPPADEPDEVWVILPHRPLVMPEAGIRHWVTRARRRLSPLTGEVFADDLGPAGPIACRLRAGAGPDRSRYHVRVLHPRADLGGTILDFEPVKLRAWYADGLSTAREAEAVEIPA
jgi:hypothetical protein